MLMRILAPRHPSRAPVAGVSAGPFPGMALSLTAHATLVAAVVAGDGSAGARSEARAGDAPSATGAERLHWVGVAAGAWGAARTRPPLAYVVPGRGGLRLSTSDARGPRDRRPASDGARHSARGVAGAAELARAERLAAARHGPSPQRTSPRLHLPAVALPDPEATLLVAGVLAAAPDLARRVSRPEDFVPDPALRAGALAQTGVGTLALLGADVHARDVPIPILGNPTPAYPAGLANAGVGGQVVVEFRIDSTGVVDPGSLRVVESTNAQFVQAVRRVLPRLRFVPAQRDEHAVSVTVRQPFLFTVRRGL